MNPIHDSSPTGWWVAGLLERHSQDGRTIYWNNYRLVRAVHWREAFHRAVAHGQSDSETGRRAFSGETEFVGITDLVPVYDEFEDGSELWWREFDNESSEPASPPLDIFTEAELEAIYESPMQLR